MLDIDQARNAATRDLDAFVARAGDLSKDDWLRPVRCEGWLVADLASHVAVSARGIAESFRRMQAASDEAPATIPTPSRDAASMMAALRVGLREFRAAFDALRPEALKRTFGDSKRAFPGIVGIQITALEMGAHRSDLEAAFGIEEPLASDVCDAITSLLPGMLMHFATGAAEKPAAPIAYRIAGSQPVTIRFCGGAWMVGEDPPEQVCEIVGDDSALSLFVLGRIPADHQSLKVIGDERASRAFKRYFPGP